MASGQIGKEYRYLDNYSGSDSGHGGAKQLVYKVMPTAFSRLEKPSGSNPFAAAIVYKGGAQFNATGENFLVTKFCRERF
jgi:hypothetical protein